jgi:excisionase family DNA binding protein
VIPRPEDLTPAEVAGRLRVSPAAVHKWLRAGRLKGYRPAGSRVWRVPLAALDECCEVAQARGEAAAPARRRGRSLAQSEERRRRAREVLAAEGVL